MVTRDDAIRLIESGMRNWPHIPRIDADDLEDLRASLEGIVRHHRQSAIAELCEGLAWYGEQARLTRLIHSEGDAGRAALSEDGGAKARALLSKHQFHRDGEEPNKTSPVNK